MTVAGWAVVVVILAASVIAYATLRARRHRNDAVPVGLDDAVVGEPVPIDASAARPAPRNITWTQQFEPRSGTLDDAARLKLIHDLEMLRAPWCVELLRQAVAEEPTAANREAAERAIRRIRLARSS